LAAVLGLAEHGGGIGDSGPAVVAAGQCFKTNDSPFLDRDKGLQMGYHHAVVQHFLYGWHGRGCRFMGEAPDLF
jgi:hypothetical protein